jgi:hypothetical protein
MSRELIITRNGLMHTRLLVLLIFSLSFKNLGFPKFRILDLIRVLKKNMQKQVFMDRSGTKYKFHGNSSTSNS